MTLLLKLAYNITCPIKKIMGDGDNHGALWEGDESITFYAVALGSNVTTYRAVLI